MITAKLCRAPVALPASLSEHADVAGNAQGKHAYAVQSVANIKPSVVVAKNVPS